MKNRKYLVLETGEVFEGGGIDRQNPFPERAGEVVFNTSHSGYEEIATDPSYFSQIVVMTAPMQGNYGAFREYWESRKLWIEGFVCLQIQDTPREHSWVDRLIENKIPILTELDTRNLVVRLRSTGTTWGGIVEAADENEAKVKADKLIAREKEKETDWVHLCSRREVEDIPGDLPAGPRVAVLDFGSKENIIRELKSRCSQLRVFPSRASAKQIADWKPDSLMLTNGPGDPEKVQVAPETVRAFLGKIPVFGICMGHQVLALALGAKTYKLKFGHRGANHPIKDELIGQIYMSSQNHGYAVDEKTLPGDAKVTHRNLNDQTVAGIFSAKLNCLGIQYHPESHPGPHEAARLFDFFVENMHEARRKESKSL